MGEGESGVSFVRDASLARGLCDSNELLSWSYPLTWWYQDVRWDGRKHILVLCRSGISVQVRQRMVLFFGDVEYTSLGYLLVV